jgi:ubiquinone/menaquinone biosynthesis C-methylase UbiE
MMVDLVPTRRHLDEVVVDGRCIWLTGWIFATDGSAIRNLEVRTFPGGVARVREVRSGGSPDVALAHPGHAAARACRFLLVLDLNDVPDDGFLVQLQPTFDTGFGRHWHVGIGLLTPPRDQLDRVGGGAEVGLEFLDYFVDYAGLTTTESVLDFGCGTGRMAIPMGRYLGTNATYVGVDVDGALIKWCETNIAAHDQRFSFMLSKARNQLYNPSGSDLEGGTIPVATASNSLAFAASVFTHLRSGQARAYLSELARSVRVGGRVLVTAFLMDALPIAGASLHFVTLDQVSWTADPSLPEFAIGYKQETLSTWAKDAGLQLRQALRGFWSGKTDGHSYQDIMIFDRV